MTDQTVHTRMPKQELNALIRALPAMLAGKVPDPHGFAAGFKARCAFTLIGLVKEAFEEKGRGGTGSDGIRWEPLKQSTIERKLSKGMTDRQLHQWREDYRAAFRELSGQTTAPEARKRAQDIATQKHERRSGRQVSSGTNQILVDTGVLRQSLSIGTLTERGPDASYAPPNEDQQYQADKAGEVVIGTNVAYAPHLHYGTRKMVARPFWPEKLPDDWMDEVMRQARVGIERIVEVIQR